MTHDFDTSHDVPFCQPRATWPKYACWGTIQKARTKTISEMLGYVQHELRDPRQLMARTCCSSAIVRGRAETGHLQVLELLVPVILATIRSASTST